MTGFGMGYGPDQVTEKALLQTYLGFLPTGLSPVYFIHRGPN